jgi:hypothetical protein
MFKLWSLKEFLSFLIGFAAGTIIVLGIANSYAFQYNLRKYRTSKAVQVESVTGEEVLKHFIQPSNSSYEQEMADKLFNDVRILCWVFTHPVPNHKTKVPHVRATWGRRCNKLLFISTQVEPGFDDIVAMPVEDGRAHLWNKTRLAMKYVYENHKNDADWFMRADDDK